MIKLIATSLLLPFSLGLVACNVEQTEEGEMPEVSVDGGNMPEFDVETAEVEVGTKEQTIDVPDVEITMPGDADGEPATDDE